MQLFQTNIANRAVRGTIWLTGVQIGGMLFSFCANIILARLLMPADFGIFALALSLTDLFFILTSWSFGLALIQAKSVSDEFIDTGYILSLSVGAGALIVALVSSFALTKFYSLQVLHFFWIFSILNVLNILGNYRASLLERELDYGKFSIVRLLSQVTSWTLSICLACIGARAWSFVGQQILMASFIFFGYRKLSRHKFRLRLERTAMKRLFRFGGQMFVSRGFEVGFYRLGYIMVGTWIGTKQLGYFNQAVTLSEMGHRLCRPALGQVPFATYSRLQDDKNKLSKSYELVNYFLLRFLTPVALIFLLVGNEVIVFLYGNKWQEAGPLLQAFSLYALALPVYENMKEFLYSQDKIPGAIYTKVIQLISLVPIMYLALKRYGLIGSAYALDIGILLGVVIIYYHAKKQIQINVKNLTMPPLLAGISTIIVWKFLEAPFHPFQSNLSNIFISISLIFGLYLALILIMERKSLLQNIGFLIRILRRDSVANMHI